MVIKPTIGRKLWFWAARETYEGYFAEKDAALQPEDATVIFVWDERCVNLQVVSHQGQVHTITSVILVQEGDPIPVGRFATWMPFQAAQAKKG